MGFKYTIQDSQGHDAAVVDIIQTPEPENVPMKAAVYLRTPDLPSDSLVVDQWYLTQANILPVWKDYTGAGVSIGQFEPGGSFAVTKEIFDFRHLDLKANVNPAWLANATPEQGGAPPGIPGMPQGSPGTTRTGMSPQMRVAKSSQAFGSGPSRPT